jgi:DNA polymerase III delta prime subunit
MKLHNCQKRFVEKGWEITHRKKFAVHNGIKIIDITYIGTHKAWNISMVKNKNFILKNGVVTHNTINAQATLRRVMEDYSKSNRFILSCNYVHKIISPIQDRCAMFRFGKLDWGHIYEGLRKICKGIKLDISEDAIKVIARNGSKGSMRKALNILEDLYITHKNKQITEIDVDEIVGHTNRKNIGELMKHAKDQNFLEFNNILQVMRIVDKMSVIEIIHEMISYVEESKWPNLVKQRLYYLLAEVEWRCTQGADEWVQMRWLLSQIKDLKDVKEVEENAKDTNGSNNINSTPGSDN